MFDRHAAARPAGSDVGDHASVRVRGRMQVVNELQDGCVVCGPAADHTRHLLAERMFGTGEPFDYHACRSCGTLQIAELPHDMNSYYRGDDYYSFAPSADRLERAARLPAVRGILRLNSRVFVRAGCGMGMAWAKDGDLKVDDSILDIGCGSGANLKRLRAYGYRRLIGADPFIDRDHKVADGVPILKRYHAEIEGAYQHVMLHHAFEHVPDPHALFRSIHRLLAPGGNVIVRMPVMGTHAWRTYGTDWVQLDAPRHLVIYTLGGFRTLAESEGFVVRSVRYDSWSFQFWGSELVRARVAFSEGSGRFDDRELRKWGAEADRLNASLDGDSACYVLAREGEV